jgi:hypothetical protein
MDTIPYKDVCNLDNDNEIAVGKGNADRRTMQVGDAEGREWGEGTMQANQQRHWHNKRHEGVR